MPANSCLWARNVRAGNLWEWTRSKWGAGDLDRPDFKSPYDPEDGRESLEGPDLRVVRGGSWDLDRRGGRCAFRDGARPDDFGYDLGVRVVLSLAGSGS
jgi:formylglycine-generating enzyme required for sulfatase activity